MWQKFPLVSALEFRWSREIPLVNQKLNFWQKNQLYYEALWFSTKLLLSLEIAKAEVIMSMIELARPPIWWITYISQAHKINNNKELTILHLQNVSWKECWITEYSVGSGNLISIHFRTPPHLNVYFTILMCTWNFRYLSSWMNQSDLKYIFN